MGWTPPPSTGGNSESSKDYLPSVGTHLANIVGLLAIGRHESTYNGVSKGYKYRCMIIFELMNETYTIEKENEEPRTVCKTITKECGLSYYNSSPLCKAVEGALGRKLTKEEGDNRHADWFDPTQVLGKAVMISVEHNEAKNDATRVYGKVTNIMQPMAGVTILEPSIVPYELNISACQELTDLTENSVWKNLSRYHQSHFEKSLEYEILVEKAKEDSLNPNSQQDMNQANPPVTTNQSAPVSQSSPPATEEPWTPDA